MQRRTFIHQASLGAVALGSVLNESTRVAGRALQSPVGVGGRALLRPAGFGGQAEARELHADVLVIGGGTGGVAATLAVARNGFRVILTEETDWIGGQLTAQAVPPDEHPWIESFGATSSYREFRSRAREFYRRNYPLLAEARARVDLNPGNGSVSRLCHEPRVALAVLYEMLAPYVSGSSVSLLLGHRPVAADVVRDTVLGVTVKSLRTGNEVTLSAPYVLDATESGDLLPMTNTEHVVGAESRAETGELHAPPAPQPANQQAFTQCFAIDYLEGEDHTVERPREYDFWKTYVPALKPPWPGRLLDWDWSDPRSLGVRHGFFDPRGPPAPPGSVSLWSYRRIADRSNFAAGSYPSDITLVNWPQNDYLLGNLVNVPAEEAARHLERAKQLSLSLLYWMQTAAPRPDGGMGWKGLRLRKDVVGTDDGLAKAPYIREARRIKAEFTVLEQHVGTEARVALTGKKPEELPAEAFPDSVGVGSYRIDLHPSTSGVNYIDISSLPFQIPLGALIPRRMENLLPAAKNIGTTHITNGCYRLHPVEWNIGEAVGMLAAFCLTRRLTPRQVRNQGKRLEEFQRFIRSRGIETAWPRPGP